MVSWVCMLPLAVGSSGQSALRMEMRFLVKVCHAPVAALQKISRHRPSLRVIFCSLLHFASGLPVAFEMVLRCASDLPVACHLLLHFPSGLPVAFDMLCHFCVSCGCSIFMISFIVRVVCLWHCICCFILRLLCPFLCGFIRTRVLSAALHLLLSPARSHLSGAVSHVLSFSSTLGVAHCTYGLTVALYLLLHRMRGLSVAFHLLSHFTSDLPVQFLLFWFIFPLVCLWHFVRR